MQMRLMRLREGFVILAAVVANPKPKKAGLEFTSTFCHLELMELKAISELPISFQALEQESKRLGFNFLGKMNQEWSAGKNLFDKRGEIVFGAFQNEDLIGIGGVNIDPYLMDQNIGRIRHLYVRKDLRRNGIALELMNKLIDHSRIHFHLLRLRTDTQEAALFYEKIGFVPTQADSATHILNLKDISLWLFSNRFTASKNSK